MGHELARAEFFFQVDCRRNCCSDECTGGTATSWTPDAVFFFVQEKIHDMSSRCSYIASGSLCPMVLLLSTTVPSCIWISDNCKQMNCCPASISGTSIWFWGMKTDWNGWKTSSPVKFLYFFGRERGLNSKKLDKKNKIRICEHIETNKHRRRARKLS